MPKANRMTDRANFRLVIDFSDKSVSRVRVLERDRDGKWMPIARPWGISLLAGLKLAKKAATLASDGVSDLKEVRAASAPRRRKLGKKPEGTGTKRPRPNGSHHEAPHNP
jgi:hypothetical protein